VRQEDVVPDDGRVVAAVLAGERDRYAVLVERYQPRLYRFALGMVSDPADAADLVQDAFVRAYSRLATCHDPARFGAWIFSVLRNRCTDFLREHRRRDVSLDPDGPYADERPGPSDQVERAELLDRVRGALAALPESQREAFLLRHVEGLSYEEMAVRLDARTGALRMRVARAREGIRDLVERGNGPGTAGRDPSLPRPSTSSGPKDNPFPGATMTRTIVILAALFAAAPLAGQTVDERIEAARARVQAAGIPVELLDARVAEGRAKGVAEERIAAAVERRAEGLARAREAIAGAATRRATAAELSAGADALEAGVDAASLRAVIQAARDEDRPVAIAVLGELVRQGMPVGEALARVEEALARRDGALARLPEQAAAARARRGPPEGAGASGRPAGAGGPPAGVPAPGAGRPTGTPRGGPPAGTPGGRP
jgi:RNA polymerase sigma-70 factor, ECF subfamily